jgi:hypothetical protein
MEEIWIRDKHPGSAILARGPALILTTKKIPDPSSSRGKLKEVGTKLTGSN